MSRKGYTGAQANNVQDIYAEVCLTQKNYMSRRQASYRKSVLIAEFLAQTHKYRYRHGKTLIGPIVEMTGYEARDRNKKMADKFFRIPLTNKAARLGQWITVKDDGTENLGLISELIRVSRAKDRARRQEIRERILDKRDLDQ